MSISYLTIFTDSFQYKLTNLTFIRPSYTAIHNKLAAAYIIYFKFVSPELNSPENWFSEWTTSGRPS